MKRKSKNRNKNGLALARIRWLFLWLAAFVFYFFYQSYLTLYLFVIVAFLPILSLLLMLYNSSRLYLDLSFTKQEITQNMCSEFIMKIQSENTPFGILKVDYQIENIFYESKKVYTNSLLCTSKQKVKKAITLRKLHYLIFWVYGRRNVSVREAVSYMYYPFIKKILH